MAVASRVILGWRKGLEGQALRIAASDSRYVRILAGPGTGKTFTMMRRIARFLEEGTNPSRILVATFTRTAAEDLRRKLENLGATGSEEIVATTLHSLCFSMLSRKDVLRSTGRVPRPLLRFEENYLLRDLDARFGNLRSRRKMLEAFLAGRSRFEQLGPGHPEYCLDQEFANSLSDWLRFHDAMLVGELVPLAYDYLSSSPGCSDSRRFDHVFVDEYQDLNQVDQMVVDLLANKATLTVAGDDNQSIYGFRHAYPKGIADFPRMHPGTQSEPLTECRRCPTSVVQVANSLMLASGASKSRCLRPCPGSKSGEVHLVRWSSPDEEASGIARIIGCYLKLGSPESAGEILVLAPRKSLITRVNQKMTECGINAETVLAEEEIFETNECQKRILLLRLLSNPHDKAALRCWLGVESSSFLATAYSKLRDACESDGLGPKEMLDQLLASKRDVPGVGSLVSRYSSLLDELRLLKGLRGKAFLDAWLPANLNELEPLRNLLEDLVDPTTSSHDLLDYITNYVARPEAPMVSSNVRLMTLHKAKGLEAHTVIVIGLVEGLIPSLPDGLDQTRIDEQRRLLYVAATRARYRLVFSTWASASQKDVKQLKASEAGWAGRGVLRVRESRFLREIGPACSTSTWGLDFINDLVLPELVS